MKRVIVACLVILTSGVLGCSNAAVEYDTEVDPFTNSVTHYGQILTEKEAYRKGSLILRCAEKDKALSLYVTPYLTDKFKKDGAILIRIDNEKPIVHTSYDLTEDKKAAFFTTGEFELIDKLKRGEQAIVRYTDSGKRERDITFKLKGVDKAFEKVQSACKT